MAYTGRPRPKGVSILGFKYMKGQGIIVKLYESQEICHFGLYKGPKGLRDAFLGSN